LLEAIGWTLPGIELTLICDKPLALTNLPVRFVPWSREAEVSVLPECDIGIAWVPDDAWSRGKCGLKVLQYQAAGLPVIANRVGVQVDMVRDGETGYQADTPAEWCEAVARLATDPPLRQQLGQQGRREVEANYSVTHGAWLWARLLRDFEDIRRSA
jgi:glycosyltransferase involved in cell wall biosynthesis